MCGPGALRTIGLGGGYHTAIEILGKEYHFGGCNQIDSGIFESRPLHQMKRSPHSNDFHMSALYYCLSGLEIECF